jgi:hypothetical protein
MTQLRQDGSDLGQKLDVSRVKRPISERKLQANRANAQRSTGPRTTAGKAVSCRNALKHGILSSTIDLASATQGLDTSSSPPCGSLVSAVFMPDSPLGQIIRVRCKLEKILIFESECAQRPNGLEQNARLIYRYERMLTRKLHAYIREHASLKDEGLNSLMKN